SSFTNVVHFWDAGSGFCMGDPINGEFELYTTTNGGSTWTSVPGANIPDPLSGEYGYTGQYEVFGDHIWFTTNKGRIYHSTDRGLNFVVYQSPLTDFGGQTQSGALSFKNVMSGIIVDNLSNVYLSDDSGASWTLTTVAGTVFAGGLCWIENTDIIFTTSGAQGASGSSYSEDGGITWTTIDGEQHLYVEFIDPVTGWSGWFNTDAVTGGIWKWLPMTTVVPSAVPDNSIRVYPNPFTGFVNIHIEGSELNDLSVDIISLQGKVVLCRHIINKNDYTIDLSSLPNGFYIMKINGMCNEQQVKLIKQY
ncbi:MAG: T9SS type A sorting domain-containing protein, partial [Bacteroidetes bacterium]|nr:T9SS type A sorting domain-containing protein [Bacteroidota bacterium]